MDKKYLKILHGAGGQKYWQISVKIKKKGFSSLEMTKKEYEVVRSGSGAETA
ncbi:MAG: hypothetical protein NTW33_12825 [Methanoregula sp.]|nr:hypothetical protein [Methanoregula sp.]